MVDAPWAPSGKIVHGIQSKLLHGCVHLSAKLATTQSVDEADDEWPRSLRSKCCAIRCHEARLAMRLFRM
jgi:hypothetical protein